MSPWHGRPKKRESLAQRQRSAVMSLPGSPKGEFPLGGTARSAKGAQS